MIGQAQCQQRRARERAGRMMKEEILVREVEQLRSAPSTCSDKVQGLVVLVMTAVGVLQLWNQG